MAEKFGACHVCGWIGPFNEFYFIGMLDDGTPMCQCIEALPCCQRQVYQCAGLPVPERHLVARYER